MGRTIATRQWTMRSGPERAQVDERAAGLWGITDKGVEGDTAVVGGVGVMGIARCRNGSCPIHIGSD